MVPRFKVPLESSPTGLLEAKAKLRPPEGGGGGGDQHVTVSFVVEKRGDREGYKGDSGNRRAAHRKKSSPVASLCQRHSFFGQCLFFHGAG
jgi:hypothetical protein